MRRVLLATAVLGALALAAHAQGREPTPQPPPSAYTASLVGNSFALKLDPEVWRLKVPGMPRIHFYPRHPKPPQEGPAKGGKLVITHEGNTRIVECAIPWAEIPEVKAKRDAGEPVKLSFRVNDNAGTACMELARERSVSKSNSSTFRDDWVQHWANEVEFGWER